MSLFLFVLSSVIPVKEANKFLWLIHSFDLVGWLWYGGTKGNKGRLLLKAAMSSIIVGWACKKEKHNAPMKLLYRKLLLLSFPHSFLTAETVLCIFYLLRHTTISSKKNTSPPPIQSCFGLKTNFLILLLSLDKERRKTGIHLAKVSISARMTGKNRHFCDVSQLVLPGVHKENYRQSKVVTVDWGFMCWILSFSIKLLITLFCPVFVTAKKQNTISKKPSQIDL